MRNVVRWGLTVLSALFLVATSTALAQAEPERVGARSEIRAFQFSGNRTFGAEELRGGLIGDADFLIASHPLAPLEACVKLLKQKLTRGYQVSGFPDVVVEVAVAERFQVKIVEGARFMAGSVRVEGATKIPVETVVKRLTERYPPQDELKMGGGGSNTYLDRTGKRIEVRPPAWEKAKPAPFGSEGRIEAELRLILSELGFLEPDASVRIVKPPGGGNEAELVVALRNEGDRAVLSEIVIHGNEQNSRQELLEFLKLTNGMPATATLAREAELLLYQSGRFKKAEAKVEPIPPNRARMIITLVESARSPKLTTLYTRAEKSFLALRRWLTESGIRRDVVEISGQFSSGIKGRATISGDEALILRIDKASAKAGEGGKYSFTMVVSSNGAGLFSPAWGTKYFVPKPKIYTFAGTGLRSSTEPDTTSHFELYGGMRSKEDMTGPSFKLETQWDPAPFLVMAHPTNATLKFDGGVLELRDSNSVLRIEENTGKLIQLAGAISEERFTVEMGNRDAIPRFLKESESQRNVYDERWPYSTFLGFLAGEAFDAAMAFGWVESPSEEVTKRAGAAVRKLIQPETFRAVDELLKWTGGEGLFHIPVDVDTSQAQDAMVAAMAGLVFRSANVVFPENSWPWTVAREAVFVLKGQTQYTGEQLDRLFDSPEMGPVGFYVTATLLQRLQPELAKRFALRGLTRLQGNYFEQDCKLLFAGETALSRSVSRIANDIQLLDEEDMKVVETLFPGSGEVVAAARRRAKEKAAPADVFAPVLNHVWENHLKTSFRQEFQKVAFGVEGATDLVPEKQ